jgi:H+/Cl- antiporter ClcA
MRRLSSWSRVLAAAACIGVLCGLSSGAFLLALDWATRARETHRWLIALLPAAGLLSGLAYWRWGRRVEAGNNLVLDEIHAPTATIPLRMAPMVFLATVATHLCGGSAGREGVAVQMGASLGDQLAGPLRLDATGRRLCLLAGISGGFAAIFGTPWAAVVFALEVLAIGALRWEGAVVCVVAAVVGDRVCLALPVVHATYAIGELPPPGAGALGWTAAVGCACGLVARLFAMSLHGVAAAARRAIAWPPLRPALGGALVALAVWALGTTRHIGLGLPLIAESFTVAEPWRDCVLKLALTVATIGLGFKGGEVTPLFCIGATLGSALSLVVPLPLGLLAGLGFVAVFAAAANAPLACTVMAMELFGPGVGAWAGLACACAWICSGHTGIYGAQRIGGGKPFSGGGAPGARLADLHDL